MDLCNRRGHAKHAQMRRSPRRLGPRPRSASCSLDAGPSKAASELGRWQHVVVDYPSPPPPSLPLWPFCQRWSRPRPNTQKVGRVHRASSLITGHDEARPGGGRSGRRTARCTASSMTARADGWHRTVSETTRRLPVVRGRVLGANRPRWPTTGPCGAGPLPPPPFSPAEDVKTSRTRARRRHPAVLSFAGLHRILGLVLAADDTSLSRDAAGLQLSATPPRRCPVAMDAPPPRVGKPDYVCSCSLRTVVATRHGPEAVASSSRRLCDSSVCR